MTRRFLLAALGTMVGLSVFAGGASAATWCVGPGTGCSPLTSAGIEDALLFANGNPGPDSVQIDPGTVTLDEPFPVTDPVLTLPIASDTTLVGAGVGQTIFDYDGSMNVPAVIEIVPSGLGVGSASGFSVNLTGEAFPSNPGGAGVSVEGGTLSDFEIAKTVDNAAGVAGLELTSGAVAHDGKISSTTAAFGGIRAPSGPATAHHIQLVGSGLGSSTGVEVPPSNAGSALDFHHLSISNFSTGVGLQNSDVTVEDSLIDLGTVNSAVGFGGTASPAGADIDLDVNRVTIVGTGPDQTGFYFYSESASTALNAALHDYVFFNTGLGYKDTYCSGGTGAYATNTVSYGKHASDGFPDFTGGECQGGIDSNDRTAPEIADFRDFDNGDYRLRWDSDLIDRGATGGSLPSNATDLEGGKRVVDGDASGGAANDLGAYEYQRTPPSISVQASTTAPAPGQQVTFTATGSDAESESFEYTWAFDDGTTASSVVAVERSFATPGVHTATVTATDEAGASSSAVATVTVTAPATTTKTATAKLTTRAKKAFVRSRSGFRKRTNPRATAFGVTYKDAQVARFELEQSARGVRKGGRCVAKGKGRGCTYFKKFTGIQRQDVTDGEIFYTFGGRFNGKRLKPGSYRVKITPFSQGGQPGQPIYVPFKLR